MLLVGRLRCPFTDSTGFSPLADSTTAVKVGDASDATGTSDVMAGRGRGRGLGRNRGLAVGAGAVLTVGLGFDTGLPLGTRLGLASGLPLGARPSPLYRRSAPRPTSSSRRTLRSMRELRPRPGSGWHPGLRSRSARARLQALVGRRVRVGREARCRDGGRGLARIRTHAGRGRSIGVHDRPAVDYMGFADAIGCSTGLPAPPSGLKSAACTACGLRYAARHQAARQLAQGGRRLGQREDADERLAALAVAGARHRPGNRRRSPRRWAGPRARPRPGAGGRIDGRTATRLRSPATTPQGVRSLPRRSTGAARRGSTAGCRPG